MTIILHITTREGWETAVSSSYYQADSLHTEGFIHCSTPEQVLGPANALFRGQQNLVLLIIQPQHVNANIIYEDCYQSGQAFPHIYGTLNLDAVSAVIEFPPNKDGTFSLPALPK